MQLACFNIEIMNGAFALLDIFSTCLMSMMSIHYLSNITHAVCCKPTNHPAGYGSCYTEDVGELFEREGWTNCSKLGYYITGVYRGSGNWLKNIEKFRCCQMATGNEITSKMLCDNYHLKTM